MTSADETVYNLLNQIPAFLPSLPIRAKRSYRSIFAPNVVKDYNEHKHSHRTMGLAVVPKPDPCQPLRRRQNDVQLPEVIPLIRPHRMPPIPKADRSNLCALKASRNYIEENISQIKSTPPTCARRYIVSDRKGNKFLIDGSGLQKEFIYKKNYGRIPSYLRAATRLPEESSSHSDATSMVLMPAEERLCLINNLKTRHEDIFAKYQRLPLRLETPSAIRKHATLTEELVQIERDIDFLEKHQRIFITHLPQELPMTAGRDQSMQAI